MQTFTCLAIDSFLRQFSCRIQNGILIWVKCPSSTQGNKILAAPENMNEFVTMNFNEYLTDIPRQREEYEVIYGTRQNAECHITSILRAGVEYLLYFMTNSRYIFVTK